MILDLVGKKFYMKDEECVVIENPKYESSSHYNCETLNGKYLGGLRKSYLTYKISKYKQDVARIENKVNLVNTDDESIKSLINYEVLPLDQDNLISLMEDTFMFKELGVWYSLKTMIEALIENNVSIVFKSNKDIEEFKDLLSIEKIDVRSNHSLIGLERHVVKESTRPFTPKITVTICVEKDIYATNYVIIYDEWFKSYLQYFVNQVKQYELVKTKEELNMKKNEYNEDKEVFENKLSELGISKEEFLELNNVYDKINKNKFLEG